MHKTIRPGMFGVANTVLAFALLAAPLSTSAGPAEPGAKGKAKTHGVYVVQMADAPVVAYKGGIKGLKATAPKKGQKIDPTSVDVLNYVAYLNGKHDNVLNQVGGGKKLYDYTHSFNGFAAQLTQAQAAKMATLDGVLSVSPDELRTMDISSTPKVDPVV